MPHYKPDTLDKKIIDLVLKDARIPFLEVARACNVSGAAIHQRIQKLTALGVIKGSEFIIDNMRSIFLSILPTLSSRVFFEYDTIK